MTFWIFAAVLTFIAALCVVLPLSAHPKTSPNTIDFDKAIYKARLSEIEKDEELGRISSEAAKAAKSDEARKLIMLSENSQQNDVNYSYVKWGNRLALASGLILLPIASLATYLFLGSPNLPDQSLASRLSVAPEQQTVDELVARAEAHLSKNPQDARGWAVLAPVYGRMGRYEDARNAWRNVLRLAPETPEIKATYAESILAVTQGVVTAEAQQLFAAELKENTASAKARFYLALALGQEGKHSEAVAAWQELIRGGTEASPWMQSARSFLADSAQTANIPLDLPTPIIPGPNAEQIEAAQNMSEDDRNAMISGMVSGLAEKLQDDPSDKEGWQRLIRAYIVLNKKEEAFSAISAARDAHKSDAEFVASLETMRLSLK